MAGIYVHIPFCKSKCSYCDFASFPDKIHLAESYMTCVYREMAMRKDELSGMTFDTVYIGGGTPSVIDENYIAFLMAAARKNFKIADGAEITIEMNPGTVSRRKVETYLACGINRFSVGLQTAIDSQLADIGRIHNLKEFQLAAALLKGRNFSVDIMLGLRGQTAADVEKSIEVAAEAGASHISTYALTPEDGTPIYTQYLNGELPDGDEVAKLYSVALNKLRALGFERYEVSNFCKKDKYSRHNLNYWRRGEYIGFGVSASSFIGGTRLTNTFDLDEYFKCLISGHFAVVNSEKVEGEDAEEEFIMLALRTAKGLSLSEFKKNFGVDFKEKYAAEIEKTREYTAFNGDFLKIKDEYLFVQNSIIVEFFK